MEWGNELAHNEWGAIIESWLDVPIFNTGSNKVKQPIQYNHLLASVVDGFAAETEHCRSPMATEISTPGGIPHHSLMSDPAQAGADTTLGSKWTGNASSLRL